MFLLDTNVISERSRPRPDERVLSWLQSRRVGEAYLSVITLAELEQGILRPSAAPGERQNCGPSWSEWRCNSLEGC